MLEKKSCDELVAHPEPGDTKGGGGGWSRNTPSPFILLKQEVSTRVTSHSVDSYADVTFYPGSLLLCTYVEIITSDIYPYFPFFCKISHHSGKLSVIFCFPYFRMNEINPSENLGEGKMNWLFSHH